MSRINYDALGVEGLKPILLQVGSTCKDLGIGFFLVGAVARNIWYSSHGERAGGTKDVDFGIYVPSEREYNQLRLALIDMFEYRPSKENAFCLLTSDGKEIDLLPFGKIEERGKVMVEGIGLISIKLDGFKEAFKYGVEEVKIGKEKYKTCSIPAIVILKMIAFDDRPDRRIKDIEDINAICMYYPEIESNMIWEKYNELYIENRTHVQVAMRVLGKEMKSIITENSFLEKRIIRIIDRALAQETNFLVHMIEDPEKQTLENKASILSEIKEGICN